MVLNGSIEIYAGGVLESGGVYKVHAPAVYL